MPKVYLTAARRRARPLVAGLLLGGLLLALLSLQSRWLGQLAEAQRLQLGQALKAGAERLASDVGEALQRITQGVTEDDLSPSDAALIEEVLPSDKDSLAQLEVEGRVFLSTRFPLPGKQQSIVVLDRTALAEVFFPPLASRAFGNEVADNYHICIVRVEPQASAEEPLYCSLGRQHAAELGPPDAQAEINFNVFQWNAALSGDAGQSAQLAGQKLEPAMGLSLLQLGNRFAMFDEDKLNNDNTPWRIEVRHVEGSLGIAMQAARRRNLFLGGGILTLLISGLGFLWVAEQRARRLAERELEFVASISHELRTPLAVIRSAGSNLQQGVVSQPERVSEYGALVERESMRLGGMIERVLRFSGDETQRAQLEPDVPLRDLIESAIADCSPWRDRKSFEVQLELPAHLPTIHADREALVSALHNLIENAIKYGPSPHLIRICATQLAAAKSIAITVSDQGPGVPRSERRRIFEPFYRGRDAREGDVLGSGLGLGVAAAAARAHGGSLELVDLDKPGASFQLKLSIAPGELEA